MPDLILESIKNFKKLSQSLDLIDLSDVKHLHDRISKYIDSREKLEQAKKEKQVSIQESADHFLGWLKQEGISLEELLESEKKTKTVVSQKKKSPKYQYLDRNGQLKFWSGSGKMPNVIKEALDSSKNILSDFLIKIKEE